MKKISLLLLLALIAIGCGSSIAEEPSVASTTERLSTVIACTSNSTCRNPLTAPAGADTTTSACGYDGTCQWHVKALVTNGYDGPEPFQCVIGIVHPCTVGNVHGTKSCQVTATSGGIATATGWGACANDFTTSGVTLPFESHACKGTVDCGNYDVFPVGGDYDDISLGCDSRVSGGTHYCTYEPAAPGSVGDGAPSNCLAGEYRTCTTSGSLPGIQLCNVIDANLNQTSWGTCHT